MAPAPFLTAEWRDVVLVNFEVAAARLPPFLPRGTRLDLHEGRALVSVVAFRFANTRLFGLPIPLHREFPEMNLRFYVRSDVADGSSRAGVVFLSERVPLPAVTAIARFAYNEPYRTLRMRGPGDARTASSHGGSRGTGEATRALQYDWRIDGGWHSLRATVAGPASVPRSGSEAQFVVAHDWGYTRQRDGGTAEYEVSRPAWRVTTATVDRFEPDARMLALIPELAGTPTSTVVSEGSLVAVSRPAPLPLD